MPPRHRVGPERRSAVQTDSRSPRPPAAAGDGDVNSTADRLQKLPKFSRASMAEDRRLPAGKTGCHPGALPRDSRVSDGVNAPMNSIKPAGFNPPTHGIPRDSGTVELLRRDHPMLASGDFRHASIGSDDFCVHLTHKSPGTQMLPPPACARCSFSSRRTQRPTSFARCLLAAVAVAVGVEAVVVFTHDRHRAGVVGAVATATCAVIVR